MELKVEDGYVNIKGLSDYLGLSENKIRDAFSGNRIPVEKEGRRYKGVDKKLIEFFEKEDLKEIIEEDYIIEELENGEYDIEFGYSAVDLKNKGIEEDSDIIRSKMINMIREGILPNYKKSSNIFLIKESDIELLRDYELDMENMIEHKEFYTIGDIMCYTGSAYDRVYKAIVDNEIPAKKEKNRFKIYGEFIDEKGLDGLKDILNREREERNEKNENNNNNKRNEDDLIKSKAMKNLVNDWWKKYENQIVVMSDLWGLAVKIPELMDKLVSEKKRYKKTHLGRMITNVVGEQIDKYEIEKIEATGQNQYKLKKVNEDVLDKEMTYIYKVEIEIDNSIFPYTQCDGEWVPVKNEMKKAQYLLDNFTEYNSNEVPCDLDGRKCDSKDNEIWFFTLLPNVNEKLILVVSHSYDEEKEQHYRYYVSPVEIGWIEDRVEVQKLEISDLEYSIERFIEDNPEHERLREMLREREWNK